MFWDFLESAEAFLCIPTTVREGSEAFSDVLGCFEVL